MIRAGLVAEVAADVGGSLIHSTIAYVTTNIAPATPAATTYRVLDSLPFKKPALVSYLRDRNIGALTIKKRGMDVSPERLRSELKLRGDEAATVVITRVGQTRRAIVVEPI